MTKKSVGAGLTEQLRHAIRQSGLSLNEIARTSGVGADRLSRFMRGQRDLTLRAADKLFSVFHLRVVSEEAERGKRRPPERKGPPR